jgi:TolA-binding protein
LVPLPTRSSAALLARSFRPPRILLRVLRHERLVSRGPAGKLARPMTKQDDARRKNLRRKLKDGVEDVNVAAEDLRWLLDELSRQQQSNDRLRRQNRRMRVKAGGDGAEVADAADPQDADPQSLGD